MHKNETKRQHGSVCESVDERLIDRGNSCELSYREYTLWEFGRRVLFQGAIPWRFTACVVLTRLSFSFCQYNCQLELELQS